MPDSSLKIFSRLLLCNYFFVQTSQNLDRSCWFEQPGLATFFISPCVNYFCLHIWHARGKKIAFLGCFLACSCRRVRWGSLPVLMSLKITIVCPQDNMHEQKILNKLMSSIYSWQSNPDDGVPRWKLD